ncbi:MAG: WXG100 family type VII secretion target [Kineosporiaceae bacterium]
MGSEHIAVNFGALDSARASMTTMQRDFNTNQEEMASGIAPLRNVWVVSGSEAAQLYDQSTNKINQHETNMIQLINEFSRRVDEARARQIAMENSIAASFG